MFSEQEYQQLIAEAQEQVRLMASIQGKRLGLVLIDDEMQVVTVNQNLLKPIVEQLLINAQARVNELKIKAR